MIIVEIGLSHEGSLGTAHAYIDPGTGTIILQALIGGIVAAGAAVSLYWRKIKSFFSKKKNDEKKPEN